MKNILRDIIKKETGRTFAVEPILADIQKIASAIDEGEHWVTGQDDASMKWEYHICKKRVVEDGRAATDISILEIKIEDKLTGDSWNVKIKGNTL